MANPYKILDFITIRNKREISISDDVNDKALDFAESVIVEKYPLRYSNAPIIVSEELAGRPAAVSKLRFDDGSHADLLCHFNDISNPLMIPEGYIFYTPDLDSMLSNVVDRTNDNTTNKSKENLNKKMSKKDKNRIQSLINRANAASAAVDADGAVATPNMTDAGIPSIVATDGEIILGNNVTNTRCSKELSSTQSRSESIKKAIKDELTASN